VAAHQQVGSFEVINQLGKLEKNGGNVASYFCDPDGRVIHSLTGPAPAEELLAEARWALARVHEGKVDASEVATAHREAMESLEQRGRTAALYQIHRLLARERPPLLADVYRNIFENILGQRLSSPDSELDHAAQAFAAAGRSKLPILLILHKGRDNQSVLREWRRTLSGGSQSQPSSIAGLADCYVVVALPLADLPAFSHRLGVPPYAAPDQGSPLFVIARSNARQLSAVTTWDKTAELAYSLAQGAVQEAKEHNRSSSQISSLLAVVEPVDAGLSAQVRMLLADSARRGSRLGPVTKHGG
jgi:hypothetical protein